MGVMWCCVNRKLPLGAGLSWKGVGSNLCSFVFWGILAALLIILLLHLGLNFLLACIYKRYRQTFVAWTGIKSPPFSLYHRRLFAT